MTDLVYAVAGIAATAPEVEAEIRAEALYHFNALKTTAAGRVATFAINPKHPEARQQCDIPLLTFDHEKLFTFMEALAATIFHDMRISSPKAAISPALGRLRPHLPADLPCSPDDFALIVTHKRFPAFLQMRQGLLRLNGLRTTPQP